MGAWDASVFGNDDAADFTFELSDAKDVAEIALIIENALDGVLLQTQPLDVSSGATGLVAAALVVAWSEPSMFGDAVDYAPQPWPRTTAPLPGHLRTKASTVLDRMKTTEGNELAQLWAESGQMSEFIAEVTRWRAHLP